MHASSRNRRLALVLGLGLLGPTVLFAGACAKVKYPRCQGDDDCRAHHEVCVQGQCHECRSDGDCAGRDGAQGSTCVDGRCQAPADGCRADADCAASGHAGVCRDGRCQPECQGLGDCPDGRPCRDGRCQAPCTSDEACGAGARCIEGACQLADQDAASGISAACQPQGSQPGEFIHLPPIQFAFNKVDIESEAQAALQQAATCLREAPASLRVVAEGHCDDRGTQEYNLALGQRRAQSVVDYLVRLGVESSRLEPRSKGENEPLCSDASEACYSQNRRVGFIQNQASGG